MSSQEKSGDELPGTDEADPLDEGLTAAADGEFAGPEDVLEMLDETE
ncbi:MAG: hypothetical protein ABEI99_06120 [Halobaculum sp.]